MERRRRRRGRELFLIHVVDEIFQVDCLPVLATDLTFAPNQLSLSDNQIANMDVLVVVDVQFNALVFQFHLNIETLDRYLHAIPLQVDA
jgi:hypothetical protein